MPNMQHIIKAEIDLARPVPELCSVIAGVVQCHPSQETAILRGVADALSARLKEIEKGDDEHD